VARTVQANRSPLPTDQITHCPGVDSGATDWYSKRACGQKFASTYGQIAESLIDRFPSVSLVLRNIWRRFASRQRAKHRGPGWAAGVGRRRRGETTFASDLRRSRLRNPLSEHTRTKNRGIRWHFLAGEEMPGREGGGPGSHRNNVSMGWPESRFNSGRHVIQADLSGSSRRQ